MYSIVQNNDMGETYVALYKILTLWDDGVCGRHELWFAEDWSREYVWKTCETSIKIWHLLYQHRLNMEIYTWYIHRVRVLIVDVRLRTIIIEDCLLMNLAFFGGGD